MGFECYANSYYGLSYLGCLQDRAGASVGGANTVVHLQASDL